MNSDNSHWKIPTIGQLLAKTCWNPFILAYDESQNCLIWCLCCLIKKICRILGNWNLTPRHRGCYILWEFRIDYKISLGYTPEDYYFDLLINVIYYYYLNSERIMDLTLKDKKLHQGDIHLIMRKTELLDVAYGNIHRHNHFEELFGNILLFLLIG